GLGRVVAESRAEGEPLDVRRQHEREPLASRPGVVFSFAERDEVVARVLGQQGLRALAQSFISSEYSPPAWRSTANTTPRSSTNTSLICAAPADEPCGAGGMNDATSRGAYGSRTS